MTEIEVLTVYLVDAMAGHDKYYRTYASDKWIVIQYGPNGTAGFGNLSWRPAVGAQSAARDVVRKKELKGYNSRQTHRFTHNLSVGNDRGAMESLVNAYVAQQANGFAPSDAPAADATPVPAAPVDATADRFAEFTSRALAAISLSVTDRSRAAVELSHLNEQWSELEQVHSKAKSYMNTLHQMMSGAKV